MDTASSLHARNVLVTGGASGLGLGCVRALAAVGARVIIADSNSQAGSSVEQELKALGSTAKFLAVDVTSIASMADMLRAALEWLPEGEAIDAAVLSAGINGNPFDLSPEPPSRLAQPDALEFASRTAATLNVNLLAVVQSVQLLVKFGMGLTALPSEATSARSTVKSITLMGSVGSYRALPRAVDYSASKWGVRGAFRSLRQQLPKVNCRINLIAPGFVKTPLLGSTVAMYEKIGVHFAKEEDVVAAVMQAASDTTCSGIAFAVTSEGIARLQDEPAGMDAATVMNDLVDRGALGTPACPMGHDEQSLQFEHDG